MGAYLSMPKTDKVSKDESGELVVVGASSMQGWRNSQEDAHNVIINFDTNTSFFAVYDGHGGAEVATYCADRLPDFLKKLDLYKNEKLEDALRKAFLEFDRSLLEPEVVEVLKILAGEKDVEDSDNMEYDEDEEDLVELHEEGHIPLNELLEKYKGHPSMPSLSKLRNEASGNSKSGDSKPQSPYLRGRRSAAIVAQATNKALMDPDSKPQGSSTSAAAAAAMSSRATNADAKPSSSRSKKNAEPVEDSTVSSSSSCQEAEAINTNGASTSSSPITAKAIKPDSSHVIRGQSGQNGSVTSSEAKAIATAEDICSKGLAGDDARVTGSNDDSIAAAKQNGSVDSSTTDGTHKKSPNKADGGATISSTTNKKSNDISILNSASEEDDDDVEYQLEKPNEYSSDDDMEENEDDDEDDEDADADNEDEDENGSDAESDEYDEDVDEEEDDEEAILANQQFCANMIEEPGKDSGCTAVVALLRGRDLYVANAGDSRCVVCRNGKAIEMSLDHKPEDEEESGRILKAGGRVTLDGRVNGGLNLSRAIGDHAYKMNSKLPLEDQMISARPDIKKLIITPEDEFMVLACDGIWNFMSSEEVVDFVGARITKENMRVSEICEELFDHCLAPDTMGDGTGCDNMTAVIVRFQPKILELPTKINPEETEDVLLKLKSDEAKIAENENHEDDINLQTKAQKRIASPTRDYDSDDVDETKQAKKIKRLKTDTDELPKTRMEADQNDDNNKESDHKAIKNLDGCLKTAKSCTETTEEQSECDSVVSTGSIASAAQTPPIVPAVSTT